MGQTPLHLSVDWVEGVRILIDSGADVDATDVAGLTPVGYATVRGNVESVQILAQAGCKLLPTRSQQFCSRPLFAEPRHSWTYHRAAENASNVAAMKSLIESLADRVKHLQEVAENTLPSRTVIALRPCILDELLDAEDASRVVQALFEAEILIPPALRWIPDDCQLLYHGVTLNVEEAENFWAAGFRDVEELDPLGRSPLMTSECRWNLVWANTLELSPWLVEKGADINRRQLHALQLEQGSLDVVRTEISSRIAAVHYIAAFFGIFLAYLQTKILRYGALPWDEHSIRHLEWAKEVVGESELRDNCRCPCSSYGCLPLAMLLKAVTPYCWDLPGKYTALLTIEDFADQMELDGSSKAGVREACLRFLKFEELELTHTCCSMEGDGYAWVNSESYYAGLMIVELHEEEDKEEIRSEQRERVQDMEELLEEFDRKYRELGVPFVEFLDTYWRDRMNEVLEGESAADEEGLRRLGVKLDDRGKVSSEMGASDASERVEELSDADEPGAS